MLKQQVELPSKIKFTEFLTELLYFTIFENKKYINISFLLLTLNVLLQIENVPQGVLCPPKE